MVKVKQDVHAYGLRVMKGEHRGLGPRDSRSPCKAMMIYVTHTKSKKEYIEMVLKTASAKSRKKKMASLNRQPMHMSMKYLKASRVWWRLDMCLHRERCVAATLRWTD